MTDRDSNRLRGLLGGRSPASFRDQGHLVQLRSELERALVLAADEVPAGIVTIGGRVRVIDLDTGERSTLTLVLPPEANVAERRISVLAPLGTALLGFRAGDDVEWEMPGGTRRLHIEHVRQPGQIVATMRGRSSRRGRNESIGAH